MKNSRQLERHFKGISNHRRIDILLLLANNALALDQIAANLDCNFKTIAGHTAKLVNAGLINKSHQGHTVLHSLSPYGKICVNFLNDFKKLK